MVRNANDGTDVQQSTSYTLSRVVPQPHARYAAAAARQQVSAFSNNNFSLVLCAKTDQTVTVTLNGSRTIIDIVDDAVASSSAASFIQEETHSSKRRRLELPRCRALEQTLRDNSNGSSCSDAGAAREEPQRLASKIRPTMEHHERTSGNMLQSFDSESSLKVSFVDYEKPTVHVGQGYGKSPGNVKYVELIRAKQPEYLVSDNAKRQSIVEDIANRFNFQWDGAPVRRNRIQEKIQKALTDTRIGPARYIREDREEPEDQEFREPDTLSDCGAGSSTLSDRAPCSDEPKPIARATAISQEEKLLFASNRTPQPDGPAVPLEVSRTRVLAEKPTVQIGHGFAKRPGNIAFRKFALAKHGDYLKSDVTQRQLLVQETAMMFNFQDHGASACASRIRDKIQDALADKRLGDQKTENPIQPDINPTASIPFLARQAVLHTKSTAESAAQEPDLQEKADSPGKMIVYCARKIGNHPGKIAYMERISLFQVEYWACGPDRQKEIIDSFFPLFDFQQPVGADEKHWQQASQASARKKIKQAFYVVRPRGRNRSSIPPVDCKQSSVVEPSVLATDPSISDSVERANLPLDLGRSLMERPIVYCGVVAWRELPGNAMYFKSLRAAHKIHAIADSQQKLAIVNALAERFEFQRQVSADSDVWQSADEAWVRDQIVKSFTTLDRRQQKKISCGIANINTIPRDQLMHGDNDRPIANDSTTEVAMDWEEVPAPVCL
jgi:hypothetical protein